MKESFRIFFSWQSDLKGTKSYIQSVIAKNIEKIVKKLDVKIHIDQDSRGEDGSKNIDEAIVQKINNCDLFIADVTPVYTVEEDETKAKKCIPNPNVMLELGYAISCLGWSRCILLWNSSCGKTNYAPFDIRNHSIKTFNYNNDTNIGNLSLTSIIKEKIEHYDDLVNGHFAISHSRYDYECYQYWKNKISVQKLHDIINDFCTNIAYAAEDFDVLDHLCWEYTNSFDHRYIDSDLKNNFESFLKVLNEMLLFAACECDPCQYDENHHAIRYKLRDYFEHLPETKAADRERTSFLKVRDMYPRIMKVLEEYRMTIARKFSE